MKIGAAAPWCGPGFAGAAPLAALVLLPFQCVLQPETLETAPAALQLVTYGGTSLCFCQRTLQADAFDIGARSLAIHEEQASRQVKTFEHLSCQEIMLARAHGSECLLDDQVQYLNVCCHTGCQHACSLDFGLCRRGDFWHVWQTGCTVGLLPTQQWRSPCHRLTFWLHFALVHQDTTGQAAD